ncbi:uncharacterized protein LOC131149146 isoform X4 [Malania oleifera]|uniref:uncharacterized protein LOC131149146 isoform X4 n=1 Tax=Malania oleifera TaxID=397392 RepID=UPI0025AE1997|nr:uncharacterized protein LOC131149146 isoform X4 [Malania oleifera]
MMMQRRLWEDEHADTVAVLGAELAASDAALGLINLPTLTKKEETRWMVPSSSSGDADMAAVGGEKMAAYSAAAAKILRRRQAGFPPVRGSEATTTLLGKLSASLPERIVGGAKLETIPNPGVLNKEPCGCGTDFLWGFSRIRSP